MTTHQPIGPSRRWGEDAPDFDKLVFEDRVHRAIYTDEGIFRMEMRKIFAAVWVYLAHESQIPKRNDFVASGEEPKLTGAMRLANCR